MKASEGYIKYVVHQIDYPQKRAPVQFLDVAVHLNWAVTS